MLLPLHWLLLSALAGMASCFAVGEFHGRDIERQHWQLVLAKQSVVAAESLARSESRRLQIERDLHELNENVERNYAAQDARIEAAYAANRLLLAQRGSLYDPQGRSDRTCRGNGVPQNPGTAGDVAGPPAGCELSTETSAALLVLARDADQAVAYARACHDWAMSIGQVSELGR